MEDYMSELIEIIDLTQNKPLNQIIYEGLRTAIIKGVIPMGERINEKSYSEALNVSRTPIREALRRIQDEDIVRYEPNYGIIVTRFTHKDIDEIYQIRKSLDILASTNAAKLMNEDKKQQMSDLLDRTDLAQKKGEVKKVIELSKEFNSLIYEFAEMPRLKTIQNRLRDYIIRFRDISLTSDDRRQLAINEHREIFNSMCTGDFDKMEKIITNHLERSREVIKLELDRQLNDQ